MDGRQNNYFYNLLKNLKHWFIEKQHPHSILNKNVFIYDLLKFLGWGIVLLILYNNALKLNQINLWIIELGSVLLLVSLYFVIRKGYHLILNLKYWFRGLNNGFKLIFAIVVVLLLLSAFFHQDAVTSSIANKYEKIRFSSFMPVDLSILNLSLANTSIFKNSVGSCPQIKVFIQDKGYAGLAISGEYDGWKLMSGSYMPYISCRKGSKEGENLNYYYCGGFSQGILGGTVNGYVEKTIIGSDGSIGKTYKHIIWNVYDQNKEFIETKCLGDPDEYEEKQARAFYNELKSWE